MCLAVAGAFGFGSAQLGMMDGRECVSLWISPGVFVHVSGMDFTFVWSYVIMCLDLCA